MADRKELAISKLLDETALEEDLADLYEYAPCGYVSTLPDGTFVKVNQTFLALTGYQRDEIASLTRLQNVLTAPSRIIYETYYDPLLHLQGFVNGTAMDLAGRDGQRLPVLINSVQKRDAAGRPHLVRTTIFNAGDRREYERDLQVARTRAEQALQTREQFLSLASHELKTPLTSILGHLQLFQRRVVRESSLSARDQRTLQIVVDQAARLNSLVVSLFDISRIETGQLTIERQPVDVCALVQRVIDEMPPTPDERVIEVQLSSQALIVQGDELRLEQVFQNLIQNAVKYSIPPTPIYVAVTQQATQVCVAVRDEGIGIPQTALPQLFERFYRATNVPGRNISGMGIGLYVVKEIVGLHGGDIQVESIEGQGSTFTVCLPLDG